MEIERYNDIVGCFDSKEKIDEYCKNEGMEFIELDGTYRFLDSVHLHWTYFITPAMELNKPYF